MTGAGSHPRYELDELIHTPVRLSVVAALAAADRMDFRLLRDTVEVSDSLLSKHLTALEDAGYVEITKGRLGRRTQTWIRLTAVGTTAFETYQQVLHRIMRPGHPHGAQEPADRVRRATMSAWAT